MLDSQRVMNTNYKSRHHINNQNFNFFNSNHLIAQKGVNIFFLMQRKDNNIYLHVRRVLKMCISLTYLIYGVEH